MNVIELGWYFLSCPRFGSVPGQTGWYETPSKSLSVAMQPPIGTKGEKAGAEAAGVVAVERRLVVARAVAALRR